MSVSVEVMVRPACRVLVGGPAETSFVASASEQSILNFTVLYNEEAEEAESENDE